MHISYYVYYSMVVIHDGITLVCADTIPCVKQEKCAIKQSDYNQKLKGLKMH